MSAIYDLDLIASEIFSFFLQYFYKGPMIPAESNKIIFIFFYKFTKIFGIPVINITTAKIFTINLSSASNNHY